MKLLSMLVSVFLFLFFSGSSLAFELYEADAQFSADVVITDHVKKEVKNGTLYVSPGKERWEHEAAGKKIAAIKRKDKKVTLRLFTDKKTYAEHAGAYGYQEFYVVKHMFLDSDGFLSPISLFFEDGAPSEIGATEFVEGIKTVEKIDVMNAGLGYNAVARRVANDGIVMKLDIYNDWSEGLGKLKEILLTVELKNVKPGKQDAALFEIPTGYTVEKNTFINETYGFSVSYPTTWQTSVQKLSDMFLKPEVKPDGAVSFKTGPEVLKADNCVNFGGFCSQDQGVMLTVFAHEMEAQDFEEFADIIRESSKYIGMEILDSQKDVAVDGVKGFSLTYGHKQEGGMKNSAALLYSKGKRYTIMYSGFGDNFDRCKGAYEEVVKSLRLL